MKKPFQNQFGFTFIEVIMAIVIVSIISVLAGMGLIQITNAYVFAKKNAVAAEQAQIALTRLTKELSAIQSIDHSAPATSATSIKYMRSGIWHTLTWAGADQPILLDGDILMDKVKAFNLSYYNINTLSPPFTMSLVAINQRTAVIQITITVNVYADTPITFIDRVVI